MNSQTRKFDSEVVAASKRALADFLQAAAGEESKFARAIRLLRKHGLTERLVAAPGTKLGWSRETLSIDRLRLGEPAHFQAVLAWLTAEWLSLIGREMDDSAVAVLRKLTADDLDFCLDGLYVNESTAVGVSRRILARNVDEIVDSSDSVARVLADLDRRMEVVGRVIGRQAEASHRRLQEALDRRFAELAECSPLCCHRDAGMPLAPQAAPACPAPEAHTSAHCLCPGASNREMLVEANCRRFLREHKDEK